MKAEQTSVGESARTVTLEMIKDLVMNDNKVDPGQDPNLVRVGQGLAQDQLLLGPDQDLALNQNPLLDLAHGLGRDLELHHHHVGLVPGQELLVVHVLDQEHQAHVEILDPVLDLQLQGVHVLDLQHLLEMVHQILRENPVLAPVGQDLGLQDNRAQNKRYIGLDLALAYSNGIIVKIFAVRNLQKFFVK